MASTYNETRVNYRIKEADGQPGKPEISVVEEDVTKQMEELVTEGKGREVEVLASQTFTFHSVSETDPLTDFVAFVPSVEEQANLINRAIILKQQQFVRRLLMQKDFTPVEGSYDLFSIIGIKSERKSATPLEKLATAFAKVLGRDVSMDELNNIIASYDAANKATA